MSFSETIFLFFLALIIFGPKKLPEIARQAGKLLAELRRASNEFKSQIETEITHLEKDEKDKAKQAPALPTAPPPGAVASMSLNPASPSLSAETPTATLAAPTVPALPDPAASIPTAPESLVNDASVPTAQGSHV